jgi:malonyl-CoA O-methyltransferase
MKPGGLVTFTALGPDSLRELRTSWSRVSDAIHVHRFIDMHDVGDALMRAGFAEPVMDTERLTVTYGSTDQLLAELRFSGSTNRASGRRRGLLSRGVNEAAVQRLDATREAASIPVTLEIVYGHAWVTQSTGASRSGTGSFSVPISRIGRR